MGQALRKDGALAEEIGDPCLGIRSANRLMESNRRALDRMDRAILIRRTEVGVFQGVCGNSLVGGRLGVKGQEEAAVPGGDLLGQASSLAQHRGHGGCP